MWRARWLILSRQRFKTRCKWLDVCHGKDSKQDVFCWGKDPRQYVKGSMAVKAKIQDKMSRDGWLILPKKRFKKRCEEPDGWFCQDKDSRQDANGWMSVMAKIQNKTCSVEVKIQDNMWRAQWLSRQRFKTRCKWLDVCHGKDSKQDVFCGGKDPRKVANSPIAVKAMIQDKMWKGWWWSLSRQRFKKRCKRTDGCQGKDSKQEDGSFC
jgi:hypothetical protein